LLKRKENEKKNEEKRRGKERREMKRKRKKRKEKKRREKKSKEKKRKEKKRKKEKKERKKRSCQAACLVKSGATCRLYVGSAFSHKGLWVYLKVAQSLPGYVTLANQFLFVFRCTLGL
jgi:Flp pilus assembly protein TadB